MEFGQGSNAMTRRCNAVDDAPVLTDRDLEVARKRPAIDRSWPVRCFAGLLLVTACTPSAGVHDVNGDGRIVVVCLGDSNTDRRWPPPDTPKWCELAAERMPEWTFINHAVSGATVTRHADPRLWGDTQLDRAVPADAADAVVLAFGTNDVRGGRMTADIVAAYEVAVTTIEATGARAFVALAPPIYPPEPEHAGALEELNRALRATFAPARLVDFHTGMGVKDFEPDGLHPNPGGQRKRAEAALRVLRPAS
jgi:lysophospholipase L1-like esterase